MADDGLLEVALFERALKQGVIEQVELADAFVDKVQVFEDGRISVNLVYDDCLEELLQVKNKREGDLYE